ncbi:hydroxyacid dehydrogenase [Desertihabitans aurantiacus]|uniref:hydroxyacid dehydrogenase n=1 Tax=Desertihabitans aurantiacus TaxID=2282477 RepID=UPI001E46EB6F|nr:hydroxyacid dehydrogenase [Desertihabitans aurantiacus]
MTRTDPAPLLRDTTTDLLPPARPRALVVMGAEPYRLQFDDARRARLAELADVVDPGWVTSFDDPRVASRLAEVDVLLTGWSAPRVDAGVLARMPRLRAVLHCAGSLRPHVSDALWDRGVMVSTSADLNAVPVAEFTYAAIVMAGKKAPFLAADARRHRGHAPREPRGRLGNSGLTIGLVGFSRIGRLVTRLVNQLHDVTCLVADPYADAAEVAAAGGELVPLAEMLPRLDVLSLHAPALPSTRHMIGAAELAALPDTATLINTARGSLVDTAALEAECVSGRLHAILDVTDPEPLPPGSPLYDLPNVMLTPHVAGSLGHETRRMSDAALDELERLVQGRPLQRRVHRDEMALSA